MTVDCSPIKVLADNPISQLSQLISIVIQVVTVVKQKLRKLRQDFPQRVLVLQCHECESAATLFDGPTAFARHTHGITFRRVKRENLLQTNLMLPPVRQIILIDPRFLTAEVKVMESYLMRIVVEADPSRSPDPIRFPTNEELMLYGEKFVKR
jgi:hypothetical protein